MKKRQAEKIVKIFERDFYYKNLFILNKAYKRLKIKKKIIAVGYMNYNKEKIPTTISLV